MIWTMLPAVGGCDGRAAPMGDAGGGHATDARPSTAPAMTAFDRQVADLEAAIAAARASADDARAMWRDAEAAERARWYVKWAAPTTTGGVEHVWIQPDNWSAYRIEGTLASEPTRALASGRARGGRVSFPAEELSDWLFVVDDGPNAAYRGGYTIDALDDLVRE